MSAADSRNIITCTALNFLTLFLHDDQNRYSHRQQDKKSRFTKQAEDMRGTTVGACQQRYQAVHGSNQHRDLVIMMKASSLPSSSLLAHEGNFSDTPTASLALSSHRNESRRRGRISPKTNVHEPAATVYESRTTSYLIVPGQADNEHDRFHVIEAVQPLLPFVTLTAYIDHGILERWFPDLDHPDPCGNHAGHHHVLLP